MSLLTLSLFIVYLLLFIIIIYLLLFIVFVFVLFMAQIGVHHSVINIFYIVSALGDYSSSSLSCMVVFLIFQYLTFFRRKFGL